VLAIRYGRVISTCVSFIFLEFNLTQTDGQTHFIATITSKTKSEGGFVSLIMGNVFYFSGSQRETIKNEVAIRHHSSFVLLL
jgi:hypothetical protein